MNHRVGTYYFFFPASTEMFRVKFNTATSSQVRLRYFSSIPTALVSCSTTPAAPLSFRCFLPALGASIPQHCWMSVSLFPTTNCRFLVHLAITIMCCANTGQHFGTLCLLASNVTSGLRVTTTTSPLAPTYHPDHFSTAITLFTTIKCTLHNSILKAQTFPCRADLIDLLRLLYREMNFPMRMRMAD